MGERKRAFGEDRVEVTFCSSYGRYRSSSAVTDSGRLTHAINRDKPMWSRCNGFGARDDGPGCFNVAKMPSKIALPMLPQPRIAMVLGSDIISEAEISRPRQGLVFRDRCLDGVGLSHCLWCVGVREISSKVI